MGCARSSYPARRLRPTRSSRRKNSRSPPRRQTCQPWAALDLAKLGKLANFCKFCRNESTVLRACRRESQMISRKIPGNFKHFCKVAGNVGMGNTGTGKLRTDTYGYSKYRCTSTKNTGTHKPQGASFGARREAALPGRAGAEGLQLAALRNRGSDLSVARAYGCADSAPSLA